MISSFDQLRVFVVADDPLARSSLVNLLASETEVVLAGQGATGNRLPADLERAAPGVVLWDLGWNPESALEFLRGFAPTQLPILVLLPDETHAIAARVENVRGLLLREIDAETLLAALGAVSQGLLVLDPVLADAVLRARPEPHSSPGEMLTRREMEVLQLVAEGLSNKIIAQRLHLSEHTIKFHLNSLMSKLNAQSRTDAVVRATRLGLIFL